ncbi:DgyrCDS14154 [Dimorphilus gyrociliatus]|uniref:DgyrCDS14154 n=1 Tax=Dimorphilus gyrociliatus TaxID=2664684 RepID=A0A7I8WD45_9ANNE|nr:DgyrCDS14154 [Dimorphilus gyrociliatus]
MDIPKQDRNSTYLRVCLKKLQPLTALDEECSVAYASLASPKWGTIIELPLKNAWMTTFTLTLQVVDISSPWSTWTFYNGALLSGRRWNSILRNVNGQLFHYKIRMVCNQNYYARDSTCKAGCLHGTCTKQGECSCDPGWQGVLCNVCKAFPGCKNGYCLDKPWQCICYKNWGGNLDYCATNSPCKNGGYCKNTADGHYICECKRGYHGLNCEYVYDYFCQCPLDFTGKNCSIPRPTRAIGNLRCLCSRNQRCLNGKCVCKPGFTGINCTDEIDNCLTDSCLNGGTCVNGLKGIVCICKDRWQGQSCELDNRNYQVNQTYSNVLYPLTKANDCQAKICQNGGTCINTGDEGFICLCKSYFEGKLCQKRKNHCHSLPCWNGGSCFERIDDFHCVCLNGFSGKQCESKINQCSSLPCPWGSSCIEKNGSFKCICPKYRSGKLCQKTVKIDFKVPYCHYKRKLYVHKEEWEDNCNLCKCFSGIVKCSKLYCPNYIFYKKRCTEDISNSLTAIKCFTPNCNKLQRCSFYNETFSSKKVCGKKNCSIVTFCFHKNRLKEGLAIAEVCDRIRRLYSIRRIFTISTLYVECSLSNSISEEKYTRRHYRLS